MGSGSGSGNSYEVEVVLSDGDEATDEDADSDIDDTGFSPVFALNAGGTEDIKAGIRSMQVTTTDDDADGPIQNQVTLRDAIETGNNGGGPAITFEAGLSGTISLQAAPPPIEESYDIDGPGASLLTIQDADSGSGIPTVQAYLAPAPASFRIYTIKAGVTSNINGETIAGGRVSGGDGGGIYNAGTLTLFDDIVLDNQAVANGGVGGNGGGIYNSASGKLTLENTHVECNSASGYGGGIDNFGALISTASQIEENYATYGAGIANQKTGNTSKLEQDTRVYDNGNLNTSSGRGIYNTGGTVSMTSSCGSIEDNSAASGGGIFVGSGTLTLKSCTIIGNQATTGDGGGIYIGKGTVSASGSGVGLIDYNSATNGDGGGIFNFAGALTLTGALNNPTQNIGPDNSAINGGGMYLGKASTTTFNGALVQGNKATGKGVGIAYEQGAGMLGLPAGLTDKDDQNGPIQV